MIREGKKELKKTRKRFLPEPRQDERIFFCTSQEKDHFGKLFLAAFNSAPTLFYLR